MTDEDVRQAIMTKLVVPPWPTAGKALNPGRSAIYEAIARGEIPVIAVGRKKPIPTSWLRHKLGIENGA
jgi:hypothetical protein